MRKAYRFNSKIVIACGIAIFAHFGRKPQNTTIVTFFRTILTVSKHFKGFNPGKVFLWYEKRLQLPNPSFCSSFESKDVQLGNLVEFDAIARVTVDFHSFWPLVLFPVDFAAIHPDSCDLPFPPESVFGLKMKSLLEHPTEFNDPFPTVHTILAISTPASDNISTAS